MADVMSEVSAFAKCMAGQDSFQGQGEGQGEGQGQGQGRHVYRERTVDDNDAIDQELLEEAVRQSLAGLGESESATSTGSTGSATTAGSTGLDGVEGSDRSAQTFPPEPFPSEPLAFGSRGPSAPLSKPMCRFVKDVTFPDGTQVQPSSVFLKTWRIRNDGTHSWPDNVVLGCAGGDDLCDPEVALPVPPLAAGQEGEMTLQLTAPESTGRFVSYFRLKTGDGSHFGQRLWADVRVVEEDNGWHVVNGVLADPGAERSSPAVPVGPAGSAEDAMVTDGNGDDDNAIDDEMSNSAASVVAVWSRVWARELEVLKDMGFSDTAVLLPVLQKYIGIPTSLCPERLGQPSAEGMQRVVAHLLGTSGILQESSTGGPSACASASASAAGGGAAGSESASDGAANSFI